VAITGLVVAIAIGIAWFVLAHKADRIERDGAAHLLDR
jgi:hypothetical protein